MDAANGERIDSWKDISAYLGRDVSTVIRWEKEKGLPIRRIPGGQRKGVFAYRHELDRWLGGLTNESGTEGTEETRSESAGAAAGQEHVSSPASNSPVAIRSSKGPDRWLAFYLAVSLLASLILVSAYTYVDSRVEIGAPQLIGQQQLTANGREKKGLLTDGKTAYFGQEQDGWYALAAMSMDGGPIRILWNPPDNVQPIEVSPDGKELLTLCSRGVEEEREVWIVPLGAGAPYRLPDVSAHSAAWSPDGRTIAYANGMEIYLTSKGQAVSKIIGSFAMVPRALSWSNDGRYLRFILDGLSAGKGVLWGQVSNDEIRTITMRPLPSSIDWNLNWTGVSRSDAYFGWMSSHKMDKGQVWLVRYTSRWWEPVIHVVPVPFVEGEVSGVAFAPEQSRLLALSKPKERAAFARFDPRLQTFRQILPGVSGTYLNYSRDGKWVAYVSNSDDSLWMRRADGSNARQLTYPPLVVELPRWSPDGKRIAYMAYHAGGPWRIYILDVESGKTQEATDDNDSQGAPTWSPDGRFISYGGVNCEARRSCAIHIIEVATRKARTIPGSEGLFTARWSPDGRFIAALALEQHHLMLFDVKTEKWRKLADGIDGTDLGWAPDSNYLYIDFPGEARIARMRIADAHQETVLDLRLQDNFNLAETEDLQFTVAPDDTVILHRQLNSPEIFAYDVREH